MPHCTSSIINSQSFLIAQGAYLLEVFDAHRVDAAFALDGFHEHRHHIRVALRRLFQGFDVVDWHAHKAFEHGAKAFFQLFVGGGAQGGDAAAVKSFFVDHDLGLVDALVVAKFSRQLDGRFVGFHAGTAKKHVGHARQFHQFGRQHFGVGHMEVVAAVNHLADLVLQGRHQFGVVVSQGVHGNACQRIQIRLAIDVPDSATLTMAECNRQSAIGVHGVR
jgi:hypothetical protein